MIWFSDLWCWIWKIWSSLRLRPNCGSVRQVGRGVDYWTPHRGWCWSPLGSNQHPRVFYSCKEKVGEGMQTWTLKDQVAHDVWESMVMKGLLYVVSRVAETFQRLLDVSGSECRNPPFFGGYLWSKVPKKRAGRLALGWLRIWIPATKYLPCKSFDAHEG